MLIVVYLTDGLLGKHACWASMLGAFRRLMNDQMTPAGFSLQNTRAEQPVALMCNYKYESNTFPMLEGLRDQTQAAQEGHPPIKAILFFWGYLETHI